MLRIAMWLAILLPTQDLAGLLEKADRLLEESKAAYEDARAKGTVAAFVEAGFKLEDARIKYLVLQEIGQGEQQKIAADRLRAVQQLSKLVHDGRVAAGGVPPASDAPAAPDAAPPPPPPPPPPAAEALKRPAIPDAAQQKQAEKQVRELFKEQYAKKGAADRKALARTLLDQAPSVKDDPTTLYVLYREALDAAVQGNDARAALEAVDGLAVAFDADPLPAKSGALGSLAKAAKAPEDLAFLADAQLQLADEHFAVDQFDLSDKACSAGLALAKKSGDVALVARAAARTKEVSEAKSKFQGMKRAFETLAKEPESAAANLELGQFFCFVKGNWDLGLTCLAKGSDAALKAAARKELAYPQPATERAAVADAWWDLAQKEGAGLRKNALLAHAASIYETCLLDATGVLKIRLQRRLEGMPKPPRGTAPSLLGPTTDLLALIDPKRDAVDGDWKLERGALRMPQGVPGRSLYWIQVPYELPAEYDLKIVAARKAGNFDLFVHLTGAGRPMLLHIDGSPAGNKHGIQTIGGKSWEDNETTVRNQKLFTDDKPHMILIAVRKNRLTFSFDGKVVIDWKTDFSTLSGENNLPNPKALGLGGWETSFEVTQLQLSAAAGQGKKLPHLK